MPEVDTNAEQIQFLTSETLFLLFALIQSSKDAGHLKSVGGKVSLPHELSKMIHPETKTKDDGFNLLNAFQGLSFGTAVVAGSKHNRASTPMSANRDSCRLM